MSTYPPDPMLVLPSYELYIGMLVFLSLQSLRGAAVILLLNKGTEFKDQQFIPNQFVPTNKVNFE